jgi:hypothetical protein
MHERLITVGEYQKRLVELCSNTGGAGFPRRNRDRHILFRSVVQTLETEKSYSERMLNEALQHWLSDVGSSLDIDHITLRRYLVDAGYVVRDAQGSRYSTRVSGNTEVEFEDAIADIDSSNVIHNARLQAAARKRQFVGR